MQERLRRTRDSKDSTHTLDPDGPPLTTTEVAELVGMSPTFIRSEIKSGQLRATKVGHGRKRVFRILIRDAIRYAKALGLF